MNDIMCPGCGFEKKHFAKGFCRNCYQNNRYRIDPTKTRNRQNKRSQRILREWKEFLKDLYGENPNCEVCGKGLNWILGDKNLVRLDHKNGLGKIITYDPSCFLKGRNCNEKNKQIFLNENFGILCAKCNACLPTENRMEWLTKVLKYMEKTNVQEKRIRTSENN